MEAKIKMFELVGRLVARIQKGCQRLMLMQGWDVVWLNLPLCSIVRRCEQFN